MRIKISEGNGIAFAKTRKNMTKTCVWCGEAMGTGKYGLSMSHRDGFVHHNVWIHLGCVEGFAKEVKKKKEGLMRAAVLEAL